MKKLKIGVLVGSLRKESFNLKTAKALIGMASENFSLEILPIGDLPLYNEDIDVTPPDSYNKFREEIKSCDGFLFFTPEYNRSVPAVLKNAIDVGSRPYGKNSWEGKPGGIVSVSMSSLGAFGANHHLRQSLVFVNVPAMQQPEAYIGNAHSLFDDGGKLANDATKDFLKNYIQAFENWVNTHAGK